MQLVAYLVKSDTISLRMVLQALRMMSMGRPVKDRRRVRPRGCEGCWLCGGEKGMGAVCGEERNKHRDC